MVVRVRSTEVTASGRITVSTAIGMVLGVLCLFAIVVTYQFLPRKQKASPNSQTRNPLDLNFSPKPTLLHRIRSTYTTLSRRYRPRNLRATDEAAISNAYGIAGETSRFGRRKGLRSLLILSDRDQTRESRDHIRKKFATSLRLDIHVPRIHTPSFSLPSPRTPSRRLYSKLDDDEASQHLTKPAAALLSPWSPSEDCYPYLEPPSTPLRTEIDDEPVTPPPLLWPPPRVYVPETPLRGSLPNVDDPFASASPVGYIRRHEKVDETKSMIEEVDYMINQWKPESEKDDAFIIGEELEDDWDAASSSDSISVYTNRSESPTKGKQ